MSNFIKRFLLNSGGDDSNNQNTPSDNNNTPTTGGETTTGNTNTQSTPTTSQTTNQQPISNVDSNAGLSADEIRLRRLNRLGGSTTTATTTPTPSSSTTKVSTPPKSNLMDTRDDHTPPKLSTPINTTPTRFQFEFGKTTH